MPETYRVIVQPEALDDLDRITAYIRQHSPQAARQVFDRLRTATQSLARLPRRYRVYRSTKDPDRVIHAMTVTPYIIYYRVVGSAKLVQVLTIHHGRQRQPRRFR